MRARRDEIEAVARRHGASNIRVFGSVGRGSARPDSDIDLVVDLEPGRSLFDHAALIDDLEDLLGVAVDVVTATGVRKSPSPHARRILDDAVLIGAGPTERLGAADQGPRGVYLELRWTIDLALRLIASGREAFDEDELMRGAAEGVWFGLAEIKSRLGDEAEQVFPEFDWRQVGPVRDAIVDPEQTLDDDALWAGIERLAGLGRLVEERTGLAAPDGLAHLHGPP